MARGAIAGRTRVVLFISVTEVRYGALRAGWGELRLRRLDRSMSDLNVVQTEEKLINHCAELRAWAHRAGHPLGQKVHEADRWVASCARLGADRRRWHLRRRIRAFTDTRRTELTERSRNVLIGSTRYSKASEIADYGRVGVDHQHEWDAQDGLLCADREVVHADVVAAVHESGLDEGLDLLPLPAGQPAADPKHLDRRPKRQPVGQLGEARVSSAS